MIPLIYCATFVFISSVFFLVGQRARNKARDPVRQRLPSALSSVRLDLGETCSKRGLAGGLAGLLPPFVFNDEELHKDLRRAGYHQPAARARFLALRNGVTIVAVLVMGTLAVGIGPGRPQQVSYVLAAGTVVAGICWGMPRVILAVMANRRVQRIRRGLPDALDMISMCLTGGLSLQHVLEHVTRQMHGAHRELAAELSLVEQQARMASLELAFQWLADRIDVPEIVSLAELIGQNQRLGTNVASSVREHADSMRTRRQQAADEKLNKAQVKLLLPTVLCLVPSAAILMWGPAALRLWDFFKGFEGASLLTP